MDKPSQEVVMASNPKYYIVEAAALPEVFLKVAEAMEAQGIV